MIYCIYIYTYAHTCLYIQVTYLHIGAHTHTDLNHHRLGSAPKVGSFQQLGVEPFGHDQAGTTHQHGGFIMIEMLVTWLVLVSKSPRVIHGYPKLYMDRNIL